VATNKDYDQTKKKIKLKKPKEMFDPRKKGRMFFTKQQTNYKNFKTYIKTKHTIWFYLTITLATLSSIMTLIVTDNPFPINYIRFVLGTIFLWILPGYSFTKVLFPRKMHQSKELNLIERSVLSFGMSFILVILNGFFIDYFPFKIQTFNVTISLFILIIFFATVAFIREHKNFKVETVRTKV
jgi:uncharacterized membrane protein